MEYKNNHITSASGSIAAKCSLDVASRDYILHTSSCGTHDLLATMSAQSRRHCKQMYTSTDGGLHCHAREERPQVIRTLILEACIHRWNNAAEDASSGNVKITIKLTANYDIMITSSPWAVTLSWQDSYMGKMTYKPSKLGQTDPVFG